MKAARILNDIVGTRLGRVLFLVAAFLLLATIVTPGPPRPAAAPGRATLTAVAVALDEAEPGRRRVGELIYLRGWALSSDDPRFGGISAMQVVDGRVTAISDTGDLFEFNLPTRAATANMRIRPLPHAAGAAKRDRDTESLVVHGARAWVGYERTNAVKRFRRADWSEEKAARPAPMRRWRPNSGPEGMVRLPDGRFLVFAEGSPRDEFSPVLLFAGDPAQEDIGATALRYRRIPGFRVTDAAVLPDGRLLILNRQLEWWGGAAAILVLAELPEPRPAAEIVARPIATLRAPLTVDNMEALSVTREGGRTIVRLASDDNFMALQRSLLLEFALEEPAR